MDGDLLILAALRDKRRYKNLIGAVPHDMLGQDAAFILDWYKNYWASYPDHDYIDLDALQALVKLRSGYEKDEMVIANHQINRLNKKFDDGAIDGVVNNLMELQFSGQAGKLITDFNNGGEIDLVYELSNLTTATLRTMNRAAPTDFIEDDIMDILEEESDDTGLKFPTRILQDHVRGLIGGDNVAIAAPTDAGKTSFLARSVVGFAQQYEQFYDADRPMIWFNNEGPGKRIKSRVYGAALSMTSNEMRALGGKKVRSLYAKNMGNQNRLRVKDIHGANLAQLSRIIEHCKPSVVIFDMVANIRVSNGSGNKTEEIEQKLQEIRELAVVHDFIAISTMQVSYEGFDMLYPPKSALKDTKVGGQGALDLLVMMGQLNNPEVYNLRGISTPKNKKQVPGKPNYARGEVVFDPERITFTDGGQ